MILDVLHPEDVLYGLIGLFKIIVRGIELVEDLPVFVYGQIVAEASQRIEFCDPVLLLE